MRRTTARKVDGVLWIVEYQWLISGAEGAAFWIAMARTAPPAEGHDGATLFLVDHDNPGLHVGRRIPTLDHAMFGGHCEVRFEDCFVADDAVLGEPGEGLRDARIRLAPARLTHC